MSDNFNILITGGAGYLGSILVPELLNDGHKVTVLDDFLFKQNSLANVCINSNFELVCGDARDESILRSIIKNKDIVIPLAALVGSPICDKDNFGAISINRDAIKLIMSFLSNSQRVLMPTTNSGYGIGSAQEPCTEDSPLNPISLYGRTKVQAEELVLERENSLSFRLATVFGMAPRMRLDLLVNDFVYRGVNDRAVILFESHFTRNFIHIRDVARAFQHAIKNFETLRGSSYNVGLSDANLSKWSLCERIKGHLSNFVFMEASIGEDPDKRDYIVSNAKFEATGYVPAYSLDDGIVELIKGYKMIKNSVYGNV
jgi:nucleoside-diphosphate-sugar epimerase